MFWGRILAAFGVLIVLIGIFQHVDPQSYVYDSDLEHKRAMVFGGAFMIVIGVIISGFGLLARSSVHDGGVGIEEPKPAVLSRGTLAILAVLAVAAVGGLVSYNEREMQAAANETPPQ